MGDVIELKQQARDLEVADIRLSERERDGFREIVFSASSEFVVSRPWGDEVLEHTADAIRAERLEAGAVPLLFNHNWNDPVGIIDRAELVDGRLEVRAHFFDTARGREVGRMVEGGLKNISVGYEIHKLEESRDGSIRVTDWEPHEISIAPVPADYQVGVGRELDSLSKPVRVERIKSQPATTAATNEGAAMQKDENGSAAAADVTVTQVTSNEKDGERQAQAFDLKAAERQRKDAIRKLARVNNIPQAVEDHWISTGADMGKVADDLLEILEERGKSQEAPALLGMSKKEVREYSVLRAVRAALTNNWKKAGLELEAHRSLESRDSLQTREERSFFVPMDVQARAPVYGTRDFNVAGAGNLVGTDHLGGSFIELLRNMSVVMSSGATRLTGLRGNVAIPKMTAGSTAYWLANETAAITESQPTIGQLLLSPKNVAALTEVSHQLIQQSDPSAEQLLLSDLAASVALAADAGALSGDGAAGQPTGIINTAGIGTGFDPGVAALDYTHVVKAQTDLVKSNAFLGSPGYVCDPDTTEKMMTRERFAGSGVPIWDGGVLAGTVAGQQARTSNQMAADTALFGAWATLILAEWGTLELAVNPNQNFAAGITGIRAWYTMDVGLRYAAAFSYANGIT